MHVPASVENIEGEKYDYCFNDDNKYGAFSVCRSLRTVTFATGSQLKSIGKYAFGECGRLKIRLPEGLKTIPEGCFKES